MATTEKTSPKKIQQKPAAPSISLPKGGGAIRGIGEKFAANPVTGTGSMIVPIATSPGRSGFGPQLSLSYDSGSGNGPFGFGWSLSLPQITRKTDKGLPRYDDATESDVFILSGAEDLVPVFKKDQRGEWIRDASGNPIIDERDRDGYTVRRYRPRIEGLFARIERWTRKSDGDVHWRSISKDNVLTLYGKDSTSRIAGPDGLDGSDNSDGHRQIFSWLICETRDDKGNAVLYEYKAEDGAGVDLTRAHQRNRGQRADPCRRTNRYLKHIRYGNRAPLLNEEGKRPRFLSDEQIDQADWMFEVVFDYGEHDLEVPRPNDSGQWGYRDDAFSSYRAGFEVRTCRLCQRVLMFHHFENEAGVGRDCLVRSTDFEYSAEEHPDDARNPVYTFLLGVTQSGYKRQNSGYLKRSLPPVQFEYSEPIVQDRVHAVQAESVENLPAGVDGTTYQWTDLFGEGLPGILTEQGGAWFYKRNLSPINLKAGNGKVSAAGHTGAQTESTDSHTSAHMSVDVETKFSPVELVAVKPNLALAGGQAQFMDLAGDGQPDLVVLDGPAPGFYENDGAEGWQPFRAFTSRLNRDTRDPNLKLVDLDGDGHADILITEDDVFVWHTSLAELGFGPACRVHQALDEEKGPRLVFADATHSVYLADLSGDGLTDLVRIRNGEVCYWPNLGYGRFGAKVTMDNAPYFDQPDQFDQKRIRLADIDGSGTTDIIYLHRDGVRLYFNQSGNSWSEPQPLRAFPRVDDLAAIMPTDLLGNGTACLVWSSPLPGDAQRQMQYVDLMGGQKPHLLVKTMNNLGAETRVQYAPSTKFYLQDKLAGKPWLTRLPFVVHVVERVETYDYISRNHFVIRYAYHHGYFDGEEREFRGFGMVEQWDTQEFDVLSASDDSSKAENIDGASHVPPVHTKTWFHTGIYIGRDHVSDFFAGMGEGDGEYYREPALRADDARDVAAEALLLPDTVLPSGLTLDEEREACRALKGSMLRQEVYAVDGTPKAEHPYTVTEQNFTIRALQPRGNSRHAVVFTHPRESLSYHYERNPADPRINHALTLEVDDFGNVLKEVAIGYGRRKKILARNEEGQVVEVPNDELARVDPHDQCKHTRLLITYTENRVTCPIDDGLLQPEDAASYPDDYRTPLPAETRTYELTGFEPEADAPRFSFDEWTREAFALTSSATEIPYQQTAETTVPQKRLIEAVRTLYRKDALTELLPLGELEPLALSGETYKLAFTPGLLAQVFQRQRVGQPSENLLPSDVINVLGGQGEDQGGYVDLDRDRHWWIPSGRVFYWVDADVTNAAATAPQELLEARQHFFLPRKFTDAFGRSSTVDYDYDLLIVRTEDPLQNTVSAANDYRVLEPLVVTDPNRNRTEVRFDALGLVVGTALMGKPLADPVEGDSLEGFQEDLTQDQIDLFYDADDPHEPAPELLKDASTRIVYDLDRFRRTRQAYPDEPTQWLPAYAATLARETHVSDRLPIKIQITFSYSDGFGREIQKKIQAEPGPMVEGGPVVSPRWVGSGWTIFNNKGKPVRQYEPFFSRIAEKRHRFEFGKKVGVSPILFYDPVERVVATLHPNNTYEKVVFDPWRQVTYDVNDTVAANGTETGDPRTDPDIEGYVAEYFKTQPDAWQTWYQERLAGTQGPHEESAAHKSEQHANTPTVAYFDTLGRPFLTVTHNRVAKNGILVDEKYPTRVELDIEGNQRSVRDAIVQNGDQLGRIVMHYDYDMLGNRIHQASMDAGERWMLNDVTGKPVRTWDSRGFVRRMTYDELRRPRGLFVTEKGVERLAEETVYGEALGDAKNHRTRVYQVFDGAGRVTNDEYDFKGNLRCKTRDLLRDYQGAVNWLDKPDPNDGTFVTSTTFDALNRPVTVTTPDASVYRATFNEAGLLDKVYVNLRGEQEDEQPKWTPFVTNVDYNAKGQRELIVYAQAAQTAYQYDPLTFRLRKLTTTRPPGRNGIAAQIFADPTLVQDLRYTYDPAGNITRIEDAALKTFYHNGDHPPVCEYQYDALYRLIEARGREHIGQTAFNFGPSSGSRRDYPFVGAAHPNDLQALREYTERYEYDAVGNFQSVRHVVNGGGWTRTYEYHARSLSESDKDGNRLTRTTLGNGSYAPESYTYTDDEGNDVHGCMTAINSMKMVWDFEDQLQRVDLGGGGTAYYVYDAAGQRVRKVIESQTGTRKKERIYLDGFEIYHEYDGDGLKVELEREALHVRDDKQRIALVDTQTKERGIKLGKLVRLRRYQLGNHLGSVTVELDENGGFISYEEYHPYGTTAFQANGGEGSLKRYRYTGKERDEESGLCYHSARYYAPWVSRWTGPDPIDLASVPTPYCFVANNPLVLADPTGLDPEAPIRLYWREGMAAAARAQQRLTRLWQQPARGVRGFVAGELSLGAHLKGGSRLDIVTPSRAFEHKLIDTARYINAKGELSAKKLNKFLRGAVRQLQKHEAAIEKHGLINVALKTARGRTRSLKETLLVGVKGANKEQLAAIRRALRISLRNAELEFKVGVYAVREFKPVTRRVPVAGLALGAIDVLQAKSSLDRLQTRTDLAATVIPSVIRHPAAVVFELAYSGTKLGEAVREYVGLRVFGRDLSIAGITAARFHAMDLMISRTIADPRRPPETQTLGYRLASRLGL